MRSPLDPAITRTSRAARGRRPHRGFTLIELMVTAGIMGVVVLGVLGTLIATQNQFTDQSGAASTQASLRTAATQLETALSRAGYGIDPNLALVTESAGGLVTTDNSGPFGSDSLVTFARDTYFRRGIQSATDTSITLSAPAVGAMLPPGERILRGQRMLALCDNGSRSAYVTVASYDAGLITLDTSVGDFLHQQSRLLEPCFSAGTAVVMRVNMAHHFIAWLADPAYPTTGRPALMVRRGLDLDGDGTANELPNGWPGAVSTSLEDSEVVALDVEQLQVAYVMNRPNTCPAGSPAQCVDLEETFELSTGVDSDANFIFGDDPATVEVPATLEASIPAWNGSAPAPSPLRPPLLEEVQVCAGFEDDDPAYCGYGGRRRFTAHVGNVRVVRFSLSARLPRAQAEGEAATALQPLGMSEPVVNMENLTVALAAGSASSHPRQRLQSSVTLKNMFQRRHFLAPLNIDPSDGLNVDGG